MGHTTPPEFISAFLNLPRISARISSAAGEIVQLILNELDNPTNFSLTSKYYYAFTQDPYVRSTYFLCRYGRIQALYWALGRGRLMTPKVIDVSIP